jgi:cold shock CspA family protein
MTGLIVTWLDRKKFGFIRPDGSDEEIFLHISDLPDRESIPVNTRVSFDLGVYGGRKKAINVEVAEGMQR